MTDAFSMPPSAGQRRILQVGPDKRIIIAANAGFCFGVARATGTVEAAISDSPPGTRLFTLGRLIHNDIYNRRLSDAGVGIIGVGDIERLSATATPESPVRVFVRAHGMTAETEALLNRARASNPCFDYVDCTCSYVKKIHRICAEQSRLNAEAIAAHTGEERVLFVLGSPNHPEVIGFLSRFEGEKHIFETAAELESIISGFSHDHFCAKVPVFVAQTTQNLLEWEKSKNIIEKVYAKSFIFGTICGVTEFRQKEAADLARECDTVVVIGGKDSSNSAKLKTICENICADTVWVEQASELTRVQSSCKTAGIVAGASTPRDIIEEVSKKMSELIQSENFEVMLEDALKTSNSIKSGDTVVGIVTAVADAEIQLDLGTKVTGVIKQSQITDDPSAKLKDMFKIGDEVEAFVIRVSDVDGFAELSKKRADSDKNWSKIVEAYETRANVEGKVVATNKGGVEADVMSYRIFIPKAQTGVPDGELETLVGQVVTMKIIEAKDKRSVKGSIRKVKDEERRAKEAEFWNTIEVGKKYTGTVKSLTEYGAFVDLGCGVDGMVHLTELTWKRIRRPADVVSVGDTLEVYVKSFDAATKRISLGCKTEATNPWKIFTSQYAVGDIATAKIVNLTTFGAFAQIVDGVDGLIHISQVADHRIEKLADVLSVGQEIDAKIIAIDEEKKKVSLSIRALIEDAKAAEAAEASEALEAINAENAEAAEETVEAPEAVETPDAE